MSRLVLVLFAIVLIATLAVGGFYLKETSFALFFQTQNSSPVEPIETVTQKALINCKSSGFNTTEDAKDYLANLIKKTGANSKKYKNSNFLQTINLGNTCWGVWTGNENGEGILFWEDTKGKIYQAKTKVEI